MHDMINPVSLGVTRPDGTDHSVIIEPQLRKTPSGQWGTTGNYKLYKDAFGDETRLFTEPLAQEVEESDLPDEVNPDFLGNLFFDPDGNWIYDGDLLSVDEQDQIADYIRTYHEGDVNY